MNNGRRPKVFEDIGTLQEELEFYFRLHNLFPSKERINYLAAELTTWYTKGNSPFDWLYLIIPRLKEQKKKTPADRKEYEKKKYYGKRYGLNTLEEIEAFKRRPRADKAVKRKQVDEIRELINEKEAKYQVILHDQEDKVLLFSSLVSVARFFKITSQGVLKAIREDRPVKKINASVKKL